MSNPFLVRDSQVYDATLGPFAPGITSFTLENLYVAVRLGGITSREPQSIKVLIDLRTHDSLHVQGALDFHGDGKISFARNFGILLRHEFDLNDYHSYSLITGPCGKQACLITREY